MKLYDRPSEGQMLGIKPIDLAMSLDSETTKGRVEAGRLVWPKTGPALRGQTTSANYYR